MRKIKENLGRVIRHKRTGDLWTVIDEGDDSFYRVVPYKNEGEEPNVAAISGFAFKMFFEWTDLVEEQYQDKEIQDFIRVKGIKEE